MTIPPDKAIELLKQQIAVGEKMAFFGIHDDDEEYGQWRTTCEGILARIDNAWAQRFWHSRYSQDGNRAQVAQLRAFIKLLEVEMAHPTPSPTSSPSRVTIHGDNARVNLNSIDQSTNIVTRTSVEIWADLQATIEREISEPAKGPLLKAVAGMNEAVGKPSFKDRYKEFMTQAANHMTVLSPFLPMLTGLL